MEINNPYNKVKKLQGELDILESNEKYLKNKIAEGISKIMNRKQLEKVESEIFFKYLEQRIIQETINWFEKYKLTEIKETNSNG